MELMTHTSTNFDDIAADSVDGIPEGFRAIKIGGPFIFHNGPLYGKWTGQRLLLGFRVEKRHTNPLRSSIAAILQPFPTCRFPLPPCTKSEMDGPFCPPSACKLTT